MPISLWGGASGQKTASSSSGGRIQRWTDTTGPVDTKPIAPTPKAVAVQQPAPQKSQSLFSRVKSGAKDMAMGIVHTGEKSLNTVAAGVGGTADVVKAGVQQAAGNKQGAQDTIKRANKTVDSLLTKGVGGQGGYISAKDAATSNPKAVIKGIAKGTADIAPLVVPVGKVAKGASLLAKVARGAAVNAVVGGGSTAVSEAADGHVKAKDVLKSAATAGVIGGVVPLAGHGAAKLASPLKDTQTLLTNTKTAAALQKLGKSDKPLPTASPTTPQPGDIIKPTPMEPTPVHAKVAEDVTNRAHIENPVVQQKMQTVAKDVEGTYKPNPVPDAHVTLDKAVTEHNGAVGEVPTVGGTLVVKDHSPAGVAKAVKGIKEQYPTAEKVPSDIPGQTKVKITTDSGHSGEITISSPEVAQASKLQADMVKNTAEAGPAHTAAAEEQASTLYKNANEAADVRLKEEQATAASKETPAAKSAPAKAEPTAKPVEKPVSSSESTPTGLTPVQTAHMPEIGGYTHSSHMEKDYADMLKGIEDGLKGGQLIKNADGTYRRTSEHSRFYRDFYKENRKAPTKADWLDEAKRQLGSGKDAMGASEDYKKLLEREGKPIPRMEIAKPTTGGGKQITPKVAKRIADDLKMHYGELATVDKMNLKEQADKAATLVDSRELLDKVISGEKPLPDGVRATAVITAIRHHPELGKDGEFLRKVANSPLAHEASFSAQELRLARENAASDPVQAIKNLKDARVKAFEAKNKTTVDKAVSGEVRAIRSAQPKVTKETFASFVDSLKC